METALYFSVRLTGEQQVLSKLFLSFLQESQLFTFHFSGISALSPVTKRGFVFHSVAFVTLIWLFFLKYTPTGHNFPCTNIQSILVQFNPKGESETSEIDSDFTTRSHRDLSESFPGSRCDLFTTYKFHFFFKQPLVSICDKFNQITTSILKYTCSYFHGLFSVRERTNFGGVMKPNRARFLEMVFSWLLST